MLFGQATYSLFIDLLVEDFYLDPLLAFFYALDQLHVSHPKRLNLIF